MAVCGGDTVHSTNEPAHKRAAVAVGFLPHRGHTAGKDKVFHRRFSAIGNKRAHVFDALDIAVKGQVFDVAAAGLAKEGRARCVAIDKEIIDGISRAVEVALKGYRVVLARGSFNFHLPADGGEIDYVFHVDIARKAEGDALGQSPLRGVCGKHLKIGCRRDQNGNVGACLYLIFVKLLHGV